MCANTFFLSQNTYDARQNVHAKKNEWGQMLKGQKYKNRAPEKKKTREEKLYILAKLLLLVTKITKSLDEDGCSEVFQFIE